MCLENRVLSAGGWRVDSAVQGPGSWSDKQLPLSLGNRKKAAPRDPVRTPLEMS